MAPVLPDRIVEMMFFYFFTTIPVLAGVESNSPLFSVIAAENISGIVLDFKNENAFYRDK